jgi:hypothetical protein
MPRFNPLNLIKPMFEDPAQYRAWFVPCSFLIPLVIILLFVVVFNLMSWLGRFAHK